MSLTSSDKLILKSFDELASDAVRERLGLPAALPEPEAAEAPEAPERTGGPVTTNGCAAVPVPLAPALPLALSPALSQPSEPGELEAPVAPGEGEPSISADPGISPDPPLGIDLTSLLAQLEVATATLSSAVLQDQEARAFALRDLARYDELVAAQGEAEQACARASEVRQAAEALRDGAFADRARAEAGQVATIAAEAEAAGTRLVQQRRQAADQLAAQLDLGRLLEERRRQEAAEQAKAAAAERARRLSGALAAARAALAAGRIEEARAVLGPVIGENPDNAEIASLMAMIAQRERFGKAMVAEDALWAARREVRDDPSAVVARLERLEVDGLPEPLARQVFGAWARACSRFCNVRGIAEPLRYAPDPGRGAVLAREQPGGPYVVISALGMGSEWESRCPVSERYVRRARPLR